VEFKDSIVTNEQIWSKITGSFESAGGELWLTIGVFAPEDSVQFLPINPTGNSTGYYLIDDVALYPCDAPVDSARAGPDAFLCQGDSLILGTHDLPEYRYYWYVDSTLISNLSNPSVSPDTTTTYRLLVKDFKFDESWDSVTVRVVNCDTIPRACAGNNSYVCLGDSIRLGCTPRDDFSYAWSTGGSPTIFSQQGQPLVSPTDTTTYILHQTDYAGQLSADTVKVIPVDCSLITASAGHDRQLCRGDSISLGQAAVPGATYAWYLSGNPVGDQAQLVVSPPHTSTYQLIVQRPDKQQLQDWCFVEVIECDVPLFIPNAFTPNGDGLNEHFDIGMPQGTRLNILIFSRWGEQLFEGDHNHPWDGRFHGRDVPDGVYYFSLTAELAPYRKTTVSGSVMVVR
jgi:gliding motility-associated-like protein